LDSFLIGLGLTAVTILSISGTFAAQIAIARRRSAILWFIYGVALGPVGPVLVWLSPPAACPVCGTRTRGWLRRCDNCGVDTTQPARGPLIGVVTGRAAAARAVAHPALLPVRGERGGGRRPTRSEPTPDSLPAAPLPAAQLPAAPPPAWADTASAAPPAASSRPGAQEPEQERPQAPTGTPEVPPAVARRMAPEPEVRAPAPAPVPAAASSPPLGGGSFVVPASASAPAESRPDRNGTPAVRAPVPAVSSSAASEPSDLGPTSLLATGVFTGGTAGLVVGARYAIVRAGVEFQVLGPLDSAPDSVVLRRPLDELDPLCVNDRCIISHRSQPTRALIAMRGIAGLTGEHLEAGLRPSPRFGVAVS
jgi:hypothetical protein